MGGFQIGNVVGLVLTPLLMSSVGIYGPFILFTSLGLLWLVTWSFSVTDDPQDTSSISKSELRLIQAGKSHSCVVKSELPPLSLLLSKRPTWAIIFANFTNNWVNVMFLFCFSISSLQIQKVRSFHGTDVLLSNVMNP